MNEQVIVEIEKFLKAPQRNDWVYADGMNLYVRKSYRYFDQVQCNNVFDIASVEITDQTSRGKGQFKHLQAYLEERLTERFDALYVESVFEERFQDHFRNAGWKQQEEVWPASFFKFLE